MGCVIVRNGEIVGRGRNRREEKQSALSHAETEAIREANAALGSWRLEDCALYVTLEPCPMCAGAIINARIPRVYYGARDSAMGACGPAGGFRLCDAFFIRNVFDLIHSSFSFLGFWLLPVARRGPCRAMGPSPTPRPRPSGRLTPP